MKLYSVSAIWKPYKAKKRTYQTALIIAESEEEAINKFKENVKYPNDAVVSAMVWDDGIYTLKPRQV